MTRESLPSAAEYLPSRLTLPAMQAAVQKCRGCDLYLSATQAVFGEGPAHAPIVMIGEQPGDDEDRKGQPFVGPAGKLLDRALSEAHIDRAAVYVTNTVKHFKYEMRGKRRLHKKPRASEIHACEPWLEAEMELVKPRVIVCLGATAAQAVFGNKYKVTQQHGIFLPHKWAPLATSTVHPSSILRAPDEARRHAEYAQFVEDLKLVKDRVEALTSGRSGTAS